MNYKEYVKSLEKTKASVFNSSRRCFGYQGENNPAINVLTSSAVGDFAAVFLDPYKGTLTVNVNNAVKMIRKFKEYGHDLSVDRLVIFNLGEDVSHYFHSQRNPRHIGRKLRLVDELNLSARNGDAAAVVSGMNRLFAHECYIEAYGKYGLRFVEKELDSFSEEVHSVYLNDIERRARELWKMVSRMLGSEERRERSALNISNFYEHSCYVTSSIIGERMAKRWEEGGYDGFVKRLDEEIVVETEKEFEDTFVKLFPSIKGSLEDLAEAMLTVGGYGSKV
jgi:hypothetical protein